MVTADKAILVTQYSNGSTFDGVTSDPFEVLAPPAEQFLSSYTVTTPASGFDLNFINLAAPTASVGSVLLDGASVSGSSFTPIPGSSFSVAQLSVGLGAHTVSGSQPLGITVYGFASYDSYGYPGGLSLSPVATVTTLTLTPKTASSPINTPHCVTATVRDQSDEMVVGVRVDFTVTGPNATIGNVNTTANGTAPFCYTGTKSGHDSILAAVGTVSDTARNEWTAGAVLTALGDAHLWVGLRNSDDQGTQFDVKVELLKNNVAVASGLKRCVTGLTRNPSLARDVIVTWNAFDPVPVSTDDVLAVRVSTRIGTNSNDTKCFGPGGSHNAAVGLRLYYDSPGRPSRFDATVSDEPSEDLYLHSNGSPCPGSGPASASVTKRFLGPRTSDGTMYTQPRVPSATNAKCNDTGVVNFTPRNSLAVIGTWSLPALP